ncbi:MAG: transglycosylase domain-containing protein [Lachnospiraceae bacterium]|nr:transglycosylase domain-containing protein [Lachnospiraceae bacterium]
MNYSRDNVKKYLSDPFSKRKRVLKKVSVAMATLLCFSLILAAVCGSSFIYGSFVSLVNQAEEITFEDVSPDNYYTTLYSSSGVAVDKLVMAGSNREEVTLAEIPDSLINAFVAIEDERYWIHNGIDIKGILRAGVIALTTGTLRQGASTITQQLIKNNVFEGGSENSVGEKLERKLKEQVLALALEKQLSKNVILENYLNTINLGSNCLGVQAAARRYFNKDVSELTISECAVIAGITKNPSRYNPIRFPEENMGRAHLVLKYMFDQGYITEEEYEEALNDNVYDRIQVVSSNTSSAIYTYFTDSVIEQVTDDLQTQLGYTQTQAYNLLYSGGLSIYTTMDTNVQKVVDEEVNDPDNYPFKFYSITYQLKITHPDKTESNYSERDVKTFMIERCGKPEDYDFLFNSEDEITTYTELFKKNMMEKGDIVTSESCVPTLQPQVSVVVIDQSTGYVKAIAGGRGKKTTNLALNRATQSTRQPGSTFKVLTTFAPAIDTCGDTLASVYYDSPISANGQDFSNWWGDEYLGYVNLRDAIAASMNLPTMHCLAETVGIDLAYKYVEKFGITTLVDYQKNADGSVYTDHVASIALGGITKGVTNLELSAAYSAIANNGYYNRPTFYTRVLRHDGTVLLEHKKDPKSVIKSSTAELLTLGMESTFGKNLATDYTSINPNIHATAIGMAPEGMSVAGKSGSTTDKNDIWFVGYTPYYTVGIWSGYDKGKALMESTGYHEEIWQRIMNRIHEGKEDIGWAESGDLVTRKICSKCGKLAVDGLCDKAHDTSVVYEEYFLKGTEPTESCTCHIKVDYCKESGKLAGEYCPEEETEERIFLVLPEELKSSDYTTDDDLYTLPADEEYCDIHKEPETETETETETEEETDDDSETSSDDETDSGDETKED